MPKHDGIDKVEELVLLAVIRLGSDAYGFTIQREIAERSGRDLAFATLYRVLDRLEVRGCVSSHVGEATPERGGRAKRFFDVTADGLRVLRQEKEAMGRMWTGVPLPSEA